MKRYKLKSAAGLIKYIDKADQKAKQQLIKTMELDNTTTTSLWDDIIRMKDTRYPNPTFISGYKARFDYGLTDTVLAGLVSENMIRTTETAPIKYAEEDCKVVAKLRHRVADLEQADVTGEFVVRGQRRYTVLDLTKWNKTKDKYRAEILEKLHKDLYGDLYHFIPKDLPIEDQIEMLKARVK